MDMDIAPAIMRLNPPPDASQMQVIGHAEGPMLVIAGPGIGQDSHYAAPGGQPPAQRPDPAL